MNHNYPKRKRTGWALDILHLCMQCVKVHRPLPCIMSSILNWCALLLACHDLGFLLVLLLPVLPVYD